MPKRTPKQPAITAGQRNILRVYSQATTDELNAGMTWYETARSEIEATLPNRYTLAEKCGIVAATSPQCPWDRNIILAAQAAKGRFRGLTTDRKAVVVAIRSGADPFAVVKGPKTSAFLDCLVHPEATRRVCVDGHIYSAWIGRRIPTSSTPNISPKMHRAIESDFQAVADSIGIRPHALQAIVWVVWRRLNPPTKRNRIKPARNAQTFPGFDTDE